MSEWFKFHAVRLHGRQTTKHTHNNNQRVSDKGPRQNAAHLRQCRKRLDVSNNETGAVTALALRKKEGAHARNSALGKSSAVSD